MLIQLSLFQVTGDNVCSLTLLDFTGNGQNEVSFMSRIIFNSRDKLAQCFQKNM